MIHFDLFCILIFTICCTAEHNQWKQSENLTHFPSNKLLPLQFLKDLLTIHPDVYEDTLLSTVQLAKKYGYDSQTHRVTTKDGYILGLHRINGSPKSPKRAGKPAVYLLHGMLESSATWVMSGVKHGFGYALADAGFDVWMGNARGNVYSRAHTTYNPDGKRRERKKFWTFSWNEIGIVDVPTTIDYILAKTNSQKLHYIGHSQGTTSFFVMCSEMPEYNAKIKMMHALAPVAYMNNAASPVMRFLGANVNTLQRTFARMGVYELFPNIDLFKIIGRKLCRGTVPTIAVCESLLFLISGFNEKNLNATMFPVFMSHTPAGISTNQLMHYSQVAHFNRFAKFDWANSQLNYVKYRSIKPPVYNLNNVKANVTLHYSDNDWLAAVKDVKRLYAQLPNAIVNHIPDPKFDHMDFVWGSNTRKMLYKDIIASMLSYDQNMDKDK